jgi:hypothetical protein
MDRDPDRQIGAREGITGLESQSRCRNAGEQPIVIFVDGRSAYGGRVGVPRRDDRRRERLVLDREPDLAWVQSPKVSHRVLAAVGRQAEEIQIHGRKGGRMRDRRRAGEADSQYQSFSHRVPLLAERNRRPCGFCDRC